jgi:hypothetical protein
MSLKFLEIRIIWALRRAGGEMAATDLQRALRAGRPFGPNLHDVEFALLRLETFGGVVAQERDHRPASARPTQRIYRVSGGVIAAVGDVPFPLKRLLQWLRLRQF